MSDGTCPRCGEARAANNRLSALAETRAAELAGARAELKELRDALRDTLGVLHKAIGFVDWNGGKGIDPDIHPDAQECKDYCEAAYVQGQSLLARTGGDADAKHDGQADTDVRRNVVAGAAHPINAEARALLAKGGEG